MKPAVECLRAADYEVKTIPLADCITAVQRWHYAKGGSNTATFRHGLFRVGDAKLLGVAWWIPPTKAAANAAFPSDWRAVLCLSRLAIDPDVPQNAASFLIARSIKLIRADKRWRFLLTYADTWQGHTGAIYRATNWTPLGLTTPEATWVDGEGRMVARKAGPKTRTKDEMLALGYKMIGRFSKARFGMPL